MDKPPFNKKPKGKEGPSSKEAAPPRPAFKRSKANLLQLSSVLPKVVRALGIDRRLKEHTFMNLWPHVVPEPFASRARPLFIDAEGNLVVAVKDAAVGQEFSFARQEMLKRLQTAARGVGMNISGLRFDMKRFYEGKLEAAQEAMAAVRLPDPSAEDLAAVVLTEEELEPTRYLGENVIDDAALVQRMRGLYEKELRLKRWREANGYPHCNYCGEVTSRLHGTDLICALCFASGMSNKEPRGSGSI